MTLTAVEGNGTRRAKSAMGGFLAMRACYRALATMLEMPRGSYHRENARTLPYRPMPMAPLLCAC